MRPKGWQSVDELNALLDGGEAIGDDGAYPDLVNPSQLHVVNDGVLPQIEDVRRPTGSFRDDWDVMEDRIAKAAVGPRGEMLDDFDQNFQVKQGEHAELVQQAPFVRQNPVSITKGVLSQQQTAVTGQPPAGGAVTPSTPASPLLKTVCYWVGDLAETTPVTVAVAPVQDVLGTLQQMGLGKLFRPYARVQFGTRDYLAIAEVDVGRGIQFTVNASQVTVEVGMDMPSDLSAQQMPVVGMLSFGAAARPMQMTRTQYLRTSVGGGDADTALVPNFAKSVLIYRNDPTAAMLVQFKDSSGNVLYQITFLANVDVLTPIYLSNDVFAITMIKTAGADTDVRAVFQLSI